MTENLVTISINEDTNPLNVHNVNNEHSEIVGKSDLTSTNNNKQQQQQSVDCTGTELINNTSNNNDTLDAEGLKQHYDVIVCGTGLVQSIVASALARCNKSVLHIDCNDYYGELDAVYTYPYLVTTKLTNTKQNEAQEQQCENTDKISNDKNDEDDEDNTQMNHDHTIKLHPKGACSSLIFHSHNAIPTDPIAYHALYPYLYESNIVYTPYGYGTIVHIPTKTTKNIRLATTSTTSNSCIKNSDENLIDMVCIHIRLLSSSNTIICIAVESSKIDCTSNDSNPATNTTTTTTTTTMNGSTNATISRIDSYYTYTRYNIVSLHYYKCNQLLNHHSRSFALDVNPTLLYAASGLAVPSLLKSNVADYIEFKSCEGLFVYNYHNTSGTTNTTTSAAAATASKNDHRTIVSHQPLLTRVPCSKNDVFATQMLSPIEKRRLMKFIQLAYDYAIVLATAAEDHTKHEQQNNLEAKHQSNELETSTSNTVIEGEEEIQTRNEKHLNAGRSLGRPQNKGIASNEMQFLQDCIKQSSMSFEQYLSNHQNLSPLLIRLVRYALALDSNSDDTVCTIQYGMNLLCQHIMSLGHFGTTAFLVPLYGSGEMSQAFCRSAAVYGATYLLRRTPLSIVLEEQRGIELGTNNNTIHTHQRDMTVLKVKGVVINVPNDETGLTFDCYNADSITQAKQQDTKLILCTHVVVPKQAITTSNYSNPNISHVQSHQSNGTVTSRRKCRVLRRICILNGKPWFSPANSTNNNQQHFLLPNQQQIRYVVVIPPKTLIRDVRDNTCSTNSMGKFRDIVTERTIHALFLDETTNVAPTIGCTVVHLTTTTIVDEDNDDSPSTSFADDRSNMTTPTNNKKIDHDSNILRYVLQSILDDCNRSYKMEQQKTQSTHNDTRTSMIDHTLQSMSVEEIFHVCFSYEIDYVAATSSTKENVNNATMNQQQQQQQIHGIEWIYRQPPKLSSDECFQQANDIFDTICPGMEFLAISKEMDETIQQRFGTNHATTTNRRGSNDDDVDQYVLESAVEMITKHNRQQQGNADGVQRKEETETNVNEH